MKKWDKNNNYQSKNAFQILIKKIKTMIFNNHLNSNQDINFRINKYKIQFKIHNKIIMKAEVLNKMIITMYKALQAKI